MKVSWLDDYTILIFDSIDSTNLEAKRLIQTGIQGKYVIVANEQTVGRGKNNSFWYSPKGNLYYSLLLQYNKDLKEISQVSLVAGLACREAICSFLQKFEASVKVKWPNDVLLNGKKVGGILAESLSYFPDNKGSPANYIIIGIGLNLEKSPKYLSYLATSLKEEKINYISSHEVLSRFMVHFHSYYTLWGMAGFASLKKEWMKNAHNIGKTIQCNMGEYKISGVFREVDDHGRLIIELETGEVHTMSSADVFF